MFSFLLIFMSGIFIFLYSFKKKLVCLLSLEMIMILLILSYLIWSLTNSGEKNSFIPLLFTCFMVLDSTLGITFLILSSRSSFAFSPLD